MSGPQSEQFFIKNKNFKFYLTYCDKMFHIHHKKEKSNNDEDTLILESVDSKKGFLVKSCTAYENGCTAYGDEHLCIMGQCMTNYYILIDRGSPRCGGNCEFKSWKLDSTRSNKTEKVYTAKILKEHPTF
jgi:hypothetical protein